MKPDDYCAQFTPIHEAPLALTDASISKVRVMAKQLSNGYPILPLPENIAALNSIVTDEKASSNPAAASPQG